MTEPREEIVINLRSLLLSSKGGVHINRVNDEYLKIFGETVPIAKLGFNNLLEFLANHPNDFVFNGNHVLAVIKSPSKHIADFVKNQKKGRKSRKNRKKTVNQEHVICSQFKQSLRDNTPSSDSRRRRRRNRHRQSKLTSCLTKNAPEVIKPKIKNEIDIKVNAIPPKPMDYNPNCWQYAVNVFRNFLANTKSSEESGNNCEIPKYTLFGEEKEILDYTKDTFTGTWDNYISFEN